MSYFTAAQDLNRVNIAQRSSATKNGHSSAKKTGLAALNQQSLIVDKQTQQKSDQQIAQ